jgi:DNA polymerase zeta
LKRKVGKKKMATPPSEAVVSVRIVGVDYYQTRPSRELDLTYSSFGGCSIDQVPVVRIFGSTPAGQRVCLHLHKLFPYFFLPYDDNLPLEQVDSYVHRLAASIERAMDVSMARFTNPFDGERGRTRRTPQKQQVFKIVAVRGKPFYGFYPCDKIFLKVFVYNPANVMRMVTLLRSGAIMGQQFQPYEAHIPFLLQVFIDCNLYGMNFVHLRTVSFRAPILKRRLPPSLRPLLVGHQQEEQQNDQEEQEQEEEEEKSWRRDEQNPNEEEDEEGGEEKRHKRRLMQQQKRKHSSGSFRWWTEAKIPPSKYSFSPRTSSCELEIDACLEDILNINDVLYTPLSQLEQQSQQQDNNDNSTLSIIDGEQRRKGNNNNDTKLVQSLAGIWDEERNRLTLAGENTSQLAGWTPEDIAEARVRPKASSKTEQLLQQKLRHLIKKDKAAKEALNNQQQKQQHQPLSSVNTDNRSQYSGSQYSQRQAPLSFSVVEKQSAGVMLGVEESETLSQLLRSTSQLNSPYLSMDEEELVRQKRKSAVSASQFFQFSQLSGSVDEAGILEALAGDDGEREEDSEEEGKTLNRLAGLEPEVDEELVLTQDMRDDREMEGILNGMQNEVEEGDEEEDEEEQDAFYSQRERNDIVSSNRLVHKLANTTTATQEEEEHEEITDESQLVLYKQNQDYKKRKLEEEEEEEEDDHLLDVDEAKREERKEGEEEEEEDDGEEEMDIPQFDGQDDFIISPSPPSSSSRKRFLDRKRNSGHSKVRGFSFFFFFLLLPSDIPGYPFFPGFFLPFLISLFLPTLTLTPLKAVLLFVQPFSISSRSSIPYSLYWFFCLLFFLFCPRQTSAEHNSFQIQTSNYYNSRTTNDGNKSNNSSVNHYSFTCPTLLNNKDNSKRQEASSVC